MKKWEITWVLRSKLPAQSPPDPNFPFGQAMDLTRDPGASCRAELQYPAPGVGTWIVKCMTCGYTAAVTAAGRADDPTMVTIPCKTVGRS